MWDNRVSLTDQEYIDACDKHYAALRAHELKMWEDAAVKVMSKMLDDMKEQQECN